VRHQRDGNGQRHAQARPSIRDGHRETRDGVEHRQRRDADRERSAEPFVAHAAKVG